MKRELEAKQKLLQGYLDQNGFEGVLFSLKANQAWLTCGGSCWVGKDFPNGCVELLLIAGEKYLLSAVNERFRLMDEELAGQGYTVVEYGWHEDKAAAFAKLASGKKIISDTGAYGTENRQHELIRLRYALMPEEIDRATALGGDAAQAMFETCMRIGPGDTEHEVSAIVTEKLMRKGIQVPCCLVASDGRIEKYRHPTPTFKKIDKTVMIVICAVQYGLVVSMTRLVSWGEISEELAKKHQACMRVDARFMERTVAGANVRDVFRAGIDAYREFGYPDEWKLHHQGGSAGYDSRDYCCNFETDEVVVSNQMFAWNPSITGTKVEDTFLLTPEGPLVLTEIKSWPLAAIETPAGVLKRPEILIR